MSDAVHHAMKSVLEDMGRAAREGRARRFMRRSDGQKHVDVKMGDVEMEPEAKGVDVTMGKLEMEPDAPGMSPKEMDELAQTLELQR